VREDALPFPAHDRDLLEIPILGEGVEVVRVAPASEGGWRILSVPVRAWGLSRGTRVTADTAEGPRLRIADVIEPSPGATVRCTVSSTCTTRQLDEEWVREGAGPRLGLGPVSIVEPETVAIHVGDRAMLPRVAAYLDRLILAGVLRTWECGDPGAPPHGTTRRIDTGPLELVHPPAVDASA
jgi:hypothetical protein